MANQSRAFIKVQCGCANKTIWRYMQWEEDERNKPTRPITHMTVSIVQPAIEVTKRVVSLHKEIRICHDS